MCMVVAHWGGYQDKTMAYIVYHINLANDYNRRQYMSLTYMPRDSDLCAPTLPVASADYVQQAVLGLTRMGNIHNMPNMHRFYCTQS